MSVGRVETLKVIMSSPTLEGTSTKNYWDVPELSAMSALKGLLQPVETGWFVTSAYDLKNENMIRTSISVFYGRGIISLHPITHRSAVFG